MISVELGPSTNGPERDSEDRDDVFKEPVIVAEVAFTVLPDDRERVPFTTTDPNTIKSPVRVAESTKTADVLTTPDEMVPVRVIG